MIEIQYDHDSGSYLAYWPDFTQEIPVCANPDLRLVLANLQELASDLTYWDNRDWFFKHEPKPVDPHAPECPF